MGVVAEENGLLGAVAGVGGAIGRAVGDMFAAEKRLQETTASGPGTGRKFAVTKETVLQAAKIIQDQADDLRRSYGDALTGMRIALDGLDEVNQDIAAAWNERLLDHPDSYAERVVAYVDSLTGLASQLRAAAHQYGFTDGEIEAALGAVGASS
ncbi:hypothetical protein [Saccharothrix algeriensis]|uniref:Uncharacterized protein n=1 Tax=Saccharothrix algeriensis TaxID=173560 RepID=A0A8T8HRE0_9PSEU|nr:hypothetical protein [Saccharothrix algeriensis]MBM7812385.1 hypothetical protein [Saccharothrix algeriensis]QTR01142.1 hypothetical protein J7S33_16725 [Saccharothrix algeriensis]